MDSTIPICEEILTTYERRGWRVSGRDPSPLRKLLVILQKVGDIVESPGTVTRLFCRSSAGKTDKGGSAKVFRSLYVYELAYQDDFDLKFGVLFETTDDNVERHHLRELLATRMLRAAASFPTLTVPRSVGVDYSDLAARVTLLFENLLLFDQPGKNAWNSIGKLKFSILARGWIERNMTIPMVLPGFPCKTPNKEKAAVNVPDGAEYEALVTLQRFCTRVQSVYDQGCRIWIVSDGHAFSDCIGDDDRRVTAYYQKLREMIEVVRSQLPVQQGGVRSLCLWDVLGLTPISYRILWNRWYGKEKCDLCAVPAVRQPVGMKVKVENEICRRLLMVMYSPPQSLGSDLLQNVPEHKLTKLYRGFSRLVFEDLAFHVDFCGQTKSEREQFAREVALEMILRNQACSRLIELGLPKHIRLSIHAHSNAGPKFAVRLLAAQSLDDSLPNLAKFFDDGDKANVEAHEQNLLIPTPWRHAIAEINHDAGPTMVVCEARMVTKALKGGLFGGYDRHHARGGRFVLWQSCAEFEKGMASDVETPVFAVRKNDFRLSEYDCTRDL